MIRVLVAEDSVTTRELLVSILRSDPELEVVGEATDGNEAVEMIRRLAPDVVTMDIRMPRLDGFEATRRIMVEMPTPIVIVSGSVDVREVQVSMHALRAGALALLEKPPGPESPHFEEQARRLVTTVKAMSQVKVVRRHPSRGPAVSPPLAVPRRSRVAPRVLAIAASTGGPAALARLVTDLPADYPLPVLVVQHIATGFVTGFAAWLNAIGSLRVKVAEHGESLAGRTVYVAPEDRHLGVEGSSAVSLSAAPPIGGFRPSATHLFASVASVFGASSLAVILTGMGRDGVDGLRAVREAGGRVLAQDEQSSVVFGMPGAAVDEGVVDATLPLAMLPRRLQELARGLPGHPDSPVLPGGEPR